MDSAALLLLAGIAAAGLSLIAGLLAFRHAEQARRDARRRVFLLRFPRSVTVAQVEAFLSTLAGLASPRLGLLGRDGAVFEIVGSAQGIRHRLRLPRASADYFVTQLRATIPGVGIIEPDEADPAGHLPHITLARELWRTDARQPLAVTDAAAVARAVLAAAAHVGRDQAAVWQWVVTGGTPMTPASTDGSLRSFLRTFWNDAETRKNASAIAYGMVSGVVRLGAHAGGHRHRQELLQRLQRAAASVSAPGARLVPRLLPSWLAVRRLTCGTTPLVSSPVLVTIRELVGLVGWPVAAPVVPGLALGGSPQLPVPAVVPHSGRVLGDATVAPVRPVAQRHPLVEPLRPLAAAGGHAL